MRKLTTLLDSQRKNKNRCPPRSHGRFRAIADSRSVPSQGSVDERGFKLEVFCGRLSPQAKS
jgi:hypothetical protein